MLARRSRTGSGGEPAGLASDPCIIFECERTRPGSRRFSPRLGNPAAGTNAAVSCAWRRFRRPRGWHRSRWPSARKLWPPAKPAPSGAVHGPAAGPWPRASAEDEANWPPAASSCSTIRTAPRSGTASSASSPTSGPSWSRKWATTRCSGPSPGPGSWKRCENHARTYRAAGGTATRVLSESFGTLVGPADSIDIELRASWTPATPDITAHLEAWSDMVCAFAGLPPLPEGVTPLPRWRAAADTAVTEPVGAARPQHELSLNCSHHDPSHSGNHHHGRRQSTTEAAETTAHIRWKASTAWSPRSSTWTHPATACRW